MNQDVLITMGFIVLCLSVAAVCVLDRCLLAIERVAGVKPEPVKPETKA